MQFWVRANKLGQDKVRGWARARTLAKAVKQSQLIVKEERRWPKVR